MELNYKLNNIQISLGSIQWEESIHNKLDVMLTYWTFYYVGQKVHLGFSITSYIAVLAIYNGSWGWTAAMPVACFQGVLRKRTITCWHICPSFKFCWIIGFLRTRVIFLDFILVSSLVVFSLETYRIVSNDVKLSQWSVQRNRGKQYNGNI